MSQIVYITLQTAESYFDELMSTGEEITLAVDIGENELTKLQEILKRSDIAFVSISGVKP